MAQLHISYVPLSVAGQLFIEREQIYNGRRAVVWVGGRRWSYRRIQEHLSFQRHLLLGMFRIHSRGLERSTGRQRAGMPVKIELKRGIEVPLWTPDPTFPPSCLCYQLTMFPKATTIFLPFHILSPSGPRWQISLTRTTLTFVWANRGSP